MSREPLSRRYARGFSLAAQFLGGLALGIGFFKLIDLPPERTALLGTVITLVTWLCDEVIRLPERRSRSGRIVHAALRMLSLTGFILALISLFEINGF